MEDAALLMSFLDCVFPLQFPMYKPEMLEGGRGWLLALVLRRESLYHAALALSAYHRWTQMPAELARTSREAVMAQQERHVGVCMQLANLGQGSCPRNNLDVATAAVQLVFFKVCHRAWRTV